MSHHESEDLADARVPRSRAVGSLLREYREFAGYSRGAVAESVGISAAELECWEIVGVPVPVSARALALADFLDIPAFAVEAAVNGEVIDGVAAAASRLPREAAEEYGAASALEDAIAFQGWTTEEVAEALGTSPTKVQAWRLGVIEMTDAERLTLSDVVRLTSERVGE